ncbi:MAG: TolC family protein [Bdellovibrionales bacterium]
MPLKQFLLVTIIFAVSSLVGGCASTSVEPGSNEYTAVIQEDRRALQDNEQVPSHIKLSIDEALDIAIHENLDARVAALEYLSSQKEITLENIKALPSMKYTLTRHGRDNQPASSSLSVLTGQQSLEPSVSQERYRSTRDISINWNIIDAASALMQGNEAADRAKISQERYQKVVQNIHRDVYAAYWSALLHEKAGTDTQKLINEVQKHILNIEIAAKERLISKTQSNQSKLPFLRSVAALEALQSEAKLARIELKSLLNLPQSTTLTLTSKPLSPLSTTHKMLKQDIEALELKALENRPEMREAFLNKNISIRKTKQEIIQTIPGADLFYALNQDTNSFLVDTSWKTYSISLVQNITSLLSFPDRYLAARKKEDLTEVRRITMAAAIMAQVHIARHGLISAEDQYQTAQQENHAAEQQAFAALKRQHAGHVSKSDTLLARSQAQEKKLEYYQSLAGFQESYAAFINALGLEVDDAVNIASSYKRAA